MWKHYFPDEPLMRSLGMTEPHWLIDDAYIKESIKKGACIAAVNGVCDGVRHHDSNG